MLLGSGDVVLIADSDGVRDIVSTEGSPIDDSTPMSVLVNKGTASASEVSRVATQLRPVNVWIMVVMLSICALL